VHAAIRLRRTNTCTRPLASIKKKKMKALSIIVLQIFLTSNLFFANTSKDYEYVWAINGLNLREAPNTKSKVIKKLTFGDSLKII